MIKMFDRDNTGTINVNEFCELWKYLGQWRQTFDRYDVDRSGNISQQELASALQQMGYRLVQCRICPRIFFSFESANVFVF